MTNENSALSGKTVVVTGADLAICARSKDELNEVGKTIEALGGPNGQTFSLERRPL